jgi:hypothetical protein
MHCIRFALMILWLFSAGVASAASCPDYNPLKNAYFGDMHSHTSYSLDAYNFGTRTDPVAAYAFATGAAVNIAEGYDASRGDVPGPNGVTISFTGGKLDFLGITDHSEWLSDDYGCTVDTSSPFYRSPLCDANSSLISARPTPLPCSGSTDGTATGCRQEQARAWQAEIAATTNANDPCTFTTFHAFEWTHVDGSAANLETLHKNVFFANENVPALPLDALNYPTAPDLWEGLAAQCLESQGCEALTIPHNSNQSVGQAFNFAGYSAMELGWMVKFQKLVEIHQHKANSECITDTADTGAVTSCDFEVDPAYARQQDRPGYVRPGLKVGIATQANNGFNPLQLGFVGATDNHNGTPGNVGESTWPGFVAAEDNTPEQRLQAERRNRRNPGGITGVWAEENTRPSIWAALQRRETFATSGPRLAVRFYANPGLANPCGDASFPAQLVAAGAVPMGGTVTHQASAAHFVVYAMQDQTPLAAVDIVKASVVNGQVVERVHTIPLASPPYCVAWTDPEFVSSDLAFYYARVKEVPTWRWSHYDCLRLKQSNPANWQTLAPGCASTDPSNGGLDVMIQERAWASPIWYEPFGAPTVVATSTAIATAPPSPTPTRRTTPSSSCAGDCSGDGEVSVDEIVTMVNIALGSQTVTTCAPGDNNHDGEITIEEILVAVNNALNECGVV